MPTVPLNGTAVDPSLIKYAEVTPQAAGLYQINFLLTGGLAADVEIRVSSVGQESITGLRLAVR